MAGDVPEDADDEPGREVCSRIADFGRERTPVSLARAMMAGAMPLPRVLRPLRTTSGSVVRTTTGLAPL